VLGLVARGQQGGQVVGLAAELGQLHVAGESVGGKEEKGKQAARP
jgi:hypothetical protein